MPIFPFLCLKFVNYQHGWEKATSKVTKSRLFCSTVAWGRLDRVLLALPILGETPHRTCCIGEHGGSTLGTWGPGVTGIQAASKGDSAECLLESKAADFSTQWSWLLHCQADRYHMLQRASKPVLHSISQALLPATGHHSQGSLQRFLVRPANFSLCHAFA